MKERKTKGSQTRATIHDVARRAKVSIYTVSRTLNNMPGVNAAARQRVLEVCRQLGMRPRQTAHQRQFALVLAQKERAPLNGYPAMLAFELLAELSSRGMGLTLFCERDVPQLSRQLFDGIFAITGHEPTIDVLAGLESTPTVVINRVSLASRFHVVGWDHEAEGRIVGEYLLQRGHRRLAMVAEFPSAHATINRLAGYRSACVSAGYGLASERIELLESRNHLAQALARVMSAQADAIYLPGQDQLGPEAVQILQDVLKVRIPQDVSVVSGEHTGWSSLITPPLTTVDAPLRLLAQRSVDHLLAMIERRPTKPIEILIATPIIERKSVTDRPVAS